MADEKIERDTSISVEEGEPILDEQDLDEPELGPESEVEPIGDSDLDLEEALAEEGEQRPPGDDDGYSDGYGGRSRARALARRGARSNKPAAHVPARFEGVKVRLRKAPAGRCTIGVEIELVFKEAEPRGEQARPGAERGVSEPGGQDIDSEELRREELEQASPGTVISERFATRASRSRGRAAKAVASPTARNKPVVKVADVQPGKKNKSVLLVQKALHKAVGLDYSSGEGTFGPATKEAYAAWQRKCGFSGSAADGEPGARTLKRLGGKYGFTVVAGARPPSKGRMPGAAWRPIPLNYTPGGQRAVRGVVIHIMDGTLGGTDSWFRNKKANASAHFGTSKAGQLHQWVSTRDRAWAQREGNPYWISVENEGRGGDALTSKQIERCAQILAWAHKAHGVPLQVTSSPERRGLGHHSMGGPAWGHSECPGPRIIAQKQEIVDRAKEIVSGKSTVV